MGDDLAGQMWFSRDPAPPWGHAPESPRVRSQGQGRVPQSLHHLVTASREQLFGSPPAPAPWKQAQQGTWGPRLRRGTAGPSAGAPLPPRCVRESGLPWAGTNSRVCREGRSLCSWCRRLGRSSTPHPACEVLPIRALPWGFREDQFQLLAAQKG